MNVIEVPAVCGAGGLDVIDTAVQRPTSSRYVRMKYASYVLEELELFAQTPT